MHVRVRLVGSLVRRGGREVEITLPDDSVVGDLLREISETYPYLGGLDPTKGILVVVDGVEAGNLQGLNTPLADGVDVALVPVTHGG